MKDARFFLGDLVAKNGIEYEEVTWEEFHQAWHQATLVDPSDGHYVGGPHAKGFYFHDGHHVVGQCHVDGSAPEGVR